MNINPISFGKTYYVPNRIHGCDIKNLEINIKTLLGVNTPIDVIKNSDGDIFVLTNEESSAYRKIAQDDQEKN